MRGTLSPKTIKDRFTAAHAIWRESHANEKFSAETADPFSGLTVRLDANSNSSREEFSAKELAKIFATSPIETRSAVSLHAGYWLPLLALYHGARLEELTGLEVGDVEDWDNGLIVHIRMNTIRPNLKQKKHSERSIPVHPALLELGFKQYVEAARAAKITALFPSFARGTTFGEAYVSHCKKLLLPEPGRLVGMHCFRHCWETARRTARIDFSIANYITGRRIERGSAAIYGRAAGMGVLFEELSKIDFGITHAPAPSVTAAELKRQDNARRLAIAAASSNRKNP